MNNAENFDNFLQAVLEGFVDGVLVLTEKQEVIYANQTAQSICQQLATDPNSLPTALQRICEALLDSQELYPQNRFAIESEITTATATFRIRGQWLRLGSDAQPCLLLRLQDQNRSLQGLAIAEAKRWSLTSRETEVWLLRRSGYTRKDIAAELYIALDTVKKHLKNIQAKRQSVLDEDTWRASQAC